MTATILQNPRIAFRAGLVGAALTVATIACAVLLMASSGSGKSTAESPPVIVPSVTVATPITKVIAEWDTYTGRMEAVDRVEVRARVDGYLQSVHFDEGQEVEVDDLLYVIDPLPYEAEVNAAKARLQQSESRLNQANAMLDEAKARASQSESQLTLAKLRFDRTKLLAQRNATSQEEVDQREAEYLQAQADIEGSRAGISSTEAAIITAKAEIEAAKAGVDTAELNLQYTAIRAPIRGRISRNLITKGNLIAGGSATSSLLTTITLLNPIFCVFDATEQDVLKYTRLDQSGEWESFRDVKHRVYLSLVDEAGFPHKGHMDFFDDSFDIDTASLRARCVFYNEDELLLPGMFARIRIRGSASYQAVLIPDSAIGTDQSSQYVYIVVDSKIQRREVTTGPMVYGLRVIRSGLDGTESLVIEGLLQARAGEIVDTGNKTGTIEVIGVDLADETEPVSEEDWISPKPDPLPENSFLQDPTYLPESTE